MRRLLAATLFAIASPAVLLAQNSFAGSNSGSAGITTASLSKPTLPPAKSPTVTDIAKTKKDKKKIHEPRALDAHITSGTLTVDGMIAKARLNYDVNTSYLYFFIPGTGTVVVAQEKFDKAEKQEKAFRGESLVVQAGGHTIELASQQSIASNKGRDAWVYLDTNYQYPDQRYPVVGFGSTRNAPYNWPGSKAAPTVETGRNNAPPIPQNLMPKLEVASSYSVTVKPSSR